MRLVFLALLSVAILLSAADNVGSAQLPKRDVIDTPLRYHSTAQVMAKRLEEQSGRNVTALHLNRRKHHSHRHHVHHSPKSQANGDNKHRGQASYVSICTALDGHPVDLRIYIAVRRRSPSL